MGLVTRRFLGPVTRQFRGLVGPPVCRAVQRQTLAFQERRARSAILGTSVDDPTSQSQRSRCFPAVASRRKEEVTLNLLSTGAGGAGKLSHEPAEGTSHSRSR